MAPNKTELQPKLAPKKKSGFPLGNKRMLQLSACVGDASIASSATSCHTETDNLDLPHLEASEAELAECTTKRGREALRSWHKRHNELVEHRKEHKHCNAPQMCEANASLGNWCVNHCATPCVIFFLTLVSPMLPSARVNKTRMEKKLHDKGEKSALNPRKIHALVAIDFAWASSKGETIWEARFRDLKTCAAKHGHCNVPTKHKLDTALGCWVSTQRKQCKEFMAGRKTLLTVKQAVGLQEFGFSWEAKKKKDDNASSMNDGNNVEEK